MQRVITFVNSLCFKSLHQKETFYRLCQNAVSCSVDSRDISAIANKLDSSRAGATLEFGLQPESFAPSGFCI